MSQPPDLATTLVEADAPTREQLVRQAEPAQLDAAISALGRRREPAAAEALDLIDRLADGRAQRKAARRELHRLRSAGVQVPERPAEAPAPVPAAETAATGEPNVHVTEAWGTDVDARGTRALWLLGERRLGGAWLAAMLLNDLEGLQELDLIDTTRKRFLRELESARREQATWVELPGEYARRLVREAVDLVRERGAGPPTRYRAFRDAFGEAPAGPERALVYETISPVEANFNPEWLEESGRLLREPETAGWHFSLPQGLRARALEVARAPTSALLVPTHPPEQQARQLLDEAAEAALEPSARRAIRRRLEETAYVFVATERLAAARLAVAAARGLQDGRVPPAQQPFIRAMLEASLARLVQGERIGGRAAPELLVELLERAAEQQHERGGPIETRPSGLILPR